VEDGGPSTDLDWDEGDILRGLVALARPCTLEEAAIKGGCSSGTARKLSRRMQQSGLIAKVKNRGGFVITEHGRQLLAAADAAAHTSSTHL
jgi:hypothetical protein